MEHKLRIFLYALIFFSGASLLAQHAVYAQTTASIDEVRNPCGADANGSFRITVTSGIGPFNVNIFNASTGEFASFPATLNVPTVIGAPPNGLSAGNIIVSVVDNDPLPNWTANLTLVSVPEITAINTTNVDNSDITCLTPNGSITIDAITGGSGSFDFAWTGPNGFTATTKDISNLGGGDYVVTITDQTANCSFTSGPITLTDPAPNAFTLSSPDLTPCAGEDFTVDLSLAEAGVEYRLYIDGAPTATAVTGPTASLVHTGGLPDGSYTISVLASLGTCAPVFSSNTLAFEVNGGPTSAVLSGDAVICAGTSTDLSVTITGGTGPYSLTLDNGIGTINNYVSGAAIPVAPAADATYNIVGNVTDANGCDVAGSGSAAVTVNPLPTAVISGGGDYCAGSPSPTVTFTFTGTAPFDFTYTNGGPPVTVTGHMTASFDIPNAPQGAYSITALSDNNGCVATDLGTPVNVTENPLPTASTSGGGTVCDGATLPDVTFSFTGTAPFDFSYTDGVATIPVTGHGDPTFTIVNAAEGSYSVTALTDANGCVATDLGNASSVVVNPLPTAAISGGGDYCVGSAAPTVTFTFTGAIPFDFSYSIDGTPFTVTGHSALTFEIPNAAEGTYSVTALSDNNLCAATDLGTPVAVTEDPLPTASTSGGGTVCDGVTLPDVIFTFTGTAPFDFTYTDGATPVAVTGHNSTSFTVSNAPAGTYSVTALADANGCVASSLGGTAVVIVNPLPTASLSGGGSVCVGSTRPDITITFIGKAPFDFTYTDGVTPVTINNHNFPTFTISNPPAATYSVTALNDDNGCVATDLGMPVSVTENPLPTANSGGGGIICAGDVLPDVTFTFTGTAPFDFTYTDGVTPVVITGHNSPSYTVTNAPAGSYSVTALTDANGCTGTSLGGDTDVTVNPLPTATLSGGGSFCAGSPAPSVTFTFTGAIPFDFTYSDGVSSFNLINNSFTYTIPNAAPGTYSITALSDNNGCVGTALGTPLEVKEEPLPTASVSGGGTVCAGTDLPEVTFTFSGTAPYDFTYTDGSTSVAITGHPASTFVIDDAVAGTYSVAALTDANGCVATNLGGDVDVIVNALPTASISGGGNHCAGSTPPTVTFTFTGAIPFDFTYTDGTTPVTVNGHGALTFDIPNAPEGDYAVTALTDNNGCAGTSLGTPVSVAENPLPTAAASGGGTICDGVALPDVTFTFTGTAPFDFTYTDGVTPVVVTAHGAMTFTITGAPAGSYSVTALSDANGCVGTDLGVSADVVVNPLPTASIAGGGAYCEGSVAPTVTFTFTGALPLNFTYSDGVSSVTVAGHNSLTFDILNPAEGTYSVTALSDNNGCAATSLGMPVVVAEDPLPTASTSGGGIVCSDGALPDVTFTFTGTAPYDFTYTDGVTPVAVTGHGANSFTVTDAPAGTWSVTALTDANACAATDLGGSATVTVEPAATVEAGNAQMICTAGTASLGGSSVGGSATTGQWSIVLQPAGGDGLLSDEDPTAMPSNIDFTATVAGDYTLRLTTDDPAGVCNAVSDEVIITVSAGGVVDAGPAQTICASGTAQLAATFSGATGITWTTTGDGSFDDPNQTDAVYTPGTNDIANKTVTLTVTTAGPCVPVADNVVITIDEDPIVDAGPAQPPICSSDWIVLDGSFGGSATGLQWTTSGDGTFFSGDDTDPNGRYMAGPNDAINGSVTLTATATGSCPGFSDNVTFTMREAATVDAGNPQTVCIGSTVPLDGTIGGSAASIIWTTSGDGAFDNVNDPDADYTPGSNDITNGSVTLTAKTNNPPGQCPAVEDNVVITFTNVPSVTTPTEPVGVCEFAADVDLSTLVSATPSGGAFVFSGPGVTGNNFDPSTLSGSQTITVDYSVGSCVATQTSFEIDVTSDASITTSNANACENGGAVDLLTLVTPTPAGGNFTFTGAGVSGNTFNPVGQSGVVDIAVDYDFNGCVESGNIQITVLAPGDPICTAGNCATVQIAPQVEPATCTNSDGRMVMSIDPWTPAVNNTGITITIDGISSTGLNITRTNINNPAFEALPVGNYNYTIEYGDPSCIKTGVFSIDQSGTVGPAVASDIVPPSCFGTSTGSITLDVPGETGNVLEWSLDGGLTDPFKPFTAGSQITGIPAGPAPTFQQVISVRRNISDVCYSSVTFDMPEAVTAISATFNITPATCNGNDGAITGITATGGHGAPYTFSIDDRQTFQASPDFNALVGGTYTLWVRDASACETDVEVIVSSPGFVNFDFDKDDADCINNRGSILVSAVDPGQFEVAMGTSQTEEPSEDQYNLFNLGSPFLFDDLSAGQYFLFVKTDAAGCATRQGPITILEYSPIDFDIEPLCNGTDLSIRLTNVTGQTSPPNMEIQIFRRPDLNTKVEPSIPPMPFPVSGEFLLKYEDHDFLKTPGEYQVSIRQVQILGGVEQGTAVCEILSERKDLIVPEPVSAQVIPLDPAASSSYPDVPTGKLKIGAFAGGLNPYEIRIQLDSASSFAMPAYDTDFAEVTVNNDHQLEKLYQDIPPGRYIVEVMDSIGCTRQLTGRVPLDIGLFIPNVFTPNGDGSNDFFFIRNLPSEEGDNQLTITNRWGTKIYASDDYQNNWDGGNAADGIYFYRLQTGAGDTRTGWLEIIRGPKP